MKLLLFLIGIVGVVFAIWWLNWVMNRNYHQGHADGFELGKHAGFEQGAEAADRWWMEMQSEVDRQASHAD